jgi:transposase
MSGPETSERFVITADTRRRWSREEKRAIVEEAARTTTSASGVARRHGIAPSLLFRWRRDFAAADRAADEAPRAPAFIPIALPAPAGAAARHEVRAACAKPGLRSGERRSGMIEIELADGRRLRIDGTVDTGVLKRVVDALESR